MDLFLLKKIISTSIMPLSIITILLFLALLFAKKKPGLSFKYLLAGFSLLLLSTMPPVADYLMQPIEDNYPAFTKQNKPVDYIVILGCGHTSDKRLPALSQLKICSLQRLVEAFRIYQLHPEAQMITSGHAFGDVMSNAQKVKQAAVSLGIPATKILVENFPKDTEEEAELIASRVKGSTVVLITNANHMPRSMKYFEEQGVNPIAAPAGYWVKNNGSTNDWRYYIPNASKLKQTTTVWYETLGRVVQWLKGLNN
ncbi:MAG: YdcF family protein [Colwellia sp.]|nr:YdcF family protein [Colwellia sp.]